MPTVFEDLAAQYGGRIIRTKVTPYAMMQACKDNDVIMAGDGQGSFIWPQFQPVVDGLMTVAKLIGFLTMQQVTLSQAIAAVPYFCLAQGQVNCPWENKGTVMRLLNQQYKDRLSEQIDGIKILLGGTEWALILPDPDQPLFHIYAQATTAEQAQDLVAKYERIVEGLQK
jgi:mannose-1-phosphate guanylyltransferase/phosphomannomutase